MTNPLALAVQHKLIAIAVVGCLGGGGAAVVITTSLPSPPPVLAPASAASAVPVQAAGTNAGGSTGGSGGAPSGAGGASGTAGSAGEATVSSPPAATSMGSHVAAAAPASTQAKTTTTPAKSGSAGTPSGGTPASSAAPSLPTSAPSAVSCPTNQRLTDAEIKWLLSEVSKTASANPSVAPGAATIKAQLTPLLGQNECAAQAQPVVTGLCSGSATRQTINAMASQMPFLVKLVVGNPCSDNLASLLPTLSSYTSLL